MRVRHVLLAASLTSAVAAQDFGKITTIQLPEGKSRVQEALHQDLNGDQRPDLVLAVRGPGSRAGRSIRVHFRMPEGAASPFSQTPDLEVEVPSSVTAFAIGDVHQSPHPELIWFGPRGAYAYRPHAPAPERTTKLFSSQFLFQSATRRSILSWQSGVRDLNGDGLVDLLLPEKDGYRIAIQRRSEQAEARFDGQFLELPESPLYDDGSSRSIQGSRQGNTFRFSLDIGSDADQPPLVEISDSVPTPSITDWDADGDLDLVAKQGDRVLVWTQGAAGEFAARPTHELNFPIDSKRSRLDPSFNSWLADFNRDRRADSILFTKDRDSDAIRTHVMFFEQTPGKPEPLFHNGVPQQLLVIAGFLSAARLEDVDGDGWMDLQVAAWRLDALDQIQGSKSIDVDFYVFLNKQGKFSRRPDLTHQETLETDSMRGSGGNNLLIRFFGDVNNDGVRELLVRTHPDRIKLLMVRKRRDKLMILDRPIHEMTIARKARVRLLTQRDQHLGFLVLEGNQVLLVTY